MAPKQGWPKQGQTSGGPLIADDFAMDSRGDYTWLRGASGDFSVGGGELVPGANGEHLFYATALAARKNAIAKVKIKLGMGSAFGLGLRIVDANNWVNFQLENDGAVKLHTSVANVWTLRAASAAIPGFSAATYYWLLAMVLGNTAAVHAFAADPESGAAPVVSTAFDLAAIAQLKAGVAGRTGLKLWPVSALDGRVDDFKVWSAAAHPFDI